MSYEQNDDMICRFKSLKRKYPDELDELGIQPMRSGFYEGTDPFEEIDTSINLDTVEALLKQQRQLNAVKRRLYATERWDCHQHKAELRVGDEATIYHPERGQLCYVEKHYDGCLYHPIRFKDKAAAYKWIESGCIADLQEGMGILGIGFVTHCFKPSESI